MKFNKKFLTRLPLHNPSYNIMVSDNYNQSVFVFVVQVINITKTEQ